MALAQVSVIQPSVRCLPSCDVVVEGSEARLRRLRPSSEINSNDEDCCTLVDHSKSPLALEDKDSAILGVDEECATRAEFRVVSWVPAGRILSADDEDEDCDIPAKDSARLVFIQDPGMCGVDVEPGTPLLGDLCELSCSRPTLTLVAWNVTLMLPEGDDV